MKKRKSDAIYDNKANIEHPPLKKQKTGGSSFFPDSFFATQENITPPPLNHSSNQSPLNVTSPASTHSSHDAVCIEEVLNLLNDINLNDINNEDFETVPDGNNMSML